MCLIFSDSPAIITPPFEKPARKQHHRRSGIEVVITALTRKSAGLWSVRVRESKELQVFFGRFDLTFTNFSCLFSCIFPGKAKTPVFTAVSPIEYKLNKVSLERYRSGYNGPDSKSGVPAMVPWVRIPPAPPTRRIVRESRKAAMFCGFLSAMYSFLRRITYETILLRKWKSILEKQRI